MSLFTKIRRALTVSKFKRHDLKIIETIPTETFAIIYFQFKEKGWELTNARGDLDVSLDSWQGKLRKGTSTLVFKWNNDDEGEIAGLTRIVEGIGKDFNLTVQSFPSK
ncbi:hypothetical protein Q4561_18685 [Alteromonas sp. 1_MG-2023]|uniref:hypothetical protein n=1 Tax=Alteromonas sp. 1_MG-2023 TaxID=3062669 RepID=UPI0026E1E9A6|nr:hypothetical protein [Alteromonas sp. 1_MG-2023]MDO6569104.1 hypothetical protein [Alteromonas sp. 1_MG-2023]